MSSYGGTAAVRDCTALDARSSAMAGTVEMLNGFRRVQFFSGERDGLQVRWRAL